MIVTIPEDIIEYILEAEKGNEGENFVGEFFGREIEDEGSRRKGGEKIIQIAGIGKMSIGLIEKLGEVSPFSLEAGDKNQSLRRVNCLSKMYANKILSNFKPVGLFLKINDPKLIKNITDIPEIGINAFPVIALIDKKEVIFYELFEEEIREIMPETIRFKADIFSRVQGIIDTNYLMDKTVAVVGLGTGGSLGAVELAKCGVGTFKLIDFDRLETHNIARHACDLDDIGRLKTHAVKDLILKKNPMARVETYEFNVLEDEERFRQIVRGTDLVFVATDNESSKLMMNRICLEEKVPAVYGAAYERAFGGDIIRVIPGETPCYDCVMGKLIQTLDFSKQRNGVIDYSSISDPSQLKAEPGLGLDVGFIVLIQAKFALLTLLRGTKSELKDIPYNMCLWGNREEWIFGEPFQCRFAETELREDCETCQIDKFYQKELGQSKEELMEIANKIVNKASKRSVNNKLLNVVKRRG